jgi:hypothetical protein
MTLQMIHQTPLQGILTFFEGFFCLFMLTRNEWVVDSFLPHMSGIKAFIKEQLLFS